MFNKWSFLLVIPESRATRRVMGSVVVVTFAVVCVVIPEGRSRESVVVVVVLLRNDRSPTETLGDDKTATTRFRIKTLRDDGTLQAAPAHTNLAGRPNSRG